MHIQKWLLGFLLFALFAGISGCTRGEKMPETSLNLRIGLMPAVDAAPILAAADRGYFEALGLTVELPVFYNAVNRQSALQAGQLDGTISDLIAVVAGIQNGADLRVTSSTDGSFPFLIRRDLKPGEKIRAGMMEISVTNYLTDRLLAPHYEVQKVFIDDIPSRLAMLRAGKLDAACIPEPMASMGELDGLMKWSPPTDSDFLPGVLVFTGGAIAQKGEALRRFYQAYNLSIDFLQQDPAYTRTLLVEAFGLKPAILDNILLPEYRRARVPDAAYLEEILAWTARTAGMEFDLTYEAVIEGKFIDHD